MYTYKGTVVNVVDGDTVDVDIDLGFKLTARLRLRLNGIDTPERGQPGYADAATYVAEQTYGKPIVVHTFKASKFGHYLARIILPDNRVLNDDLVELGYAKPYSGGKKA
jgi:micrococcal nuclease